MRIGIPSTIRCIFVKYSLRLGSSIQSQVNGKVIQQVVHILLPLIEMKKKRTMFKMTPMIDGLTILNSEFQSISEHRSSLV